MRLNNKHLASHPSSMYLQRTRNVGTSRRHLQHISHQVVDGRICIRPLRLMRHYVTSLSWDIRCVPNVSPTFTQQSRSCKRVVILGATSYKVMGATCISTVWCTSQTSSSFVFQKCICIKIYETYMDENENIRSTNVKAIRKI